MQQEYRLKKSRSFEIIFKKGQRVFSDVLVLSYLVSRGNSKKVGFSVGKKVGKAVVRNKVKRRLKEGFRSLIPNVKCGYSYVVSARSIASEKSYKELLDDLVILLKRAGLWIEE